LLTSSIIPPNIQIDEIPNNVGSVDMCPHNQTVQIFSGSGDLRKLAFFAHTTWKPPNMRSLKNFRGYTHDTFPDLMAGKDRADLVDSTLKMKRLFPSIIMVALSPEL
jgi:hypothetical protein